uniref:Glycosyltransferase family 92 protein n=1 Tax=Caenorhabditis tropicalis TaxID=1561998 RepID=A0A1I7TPR9_9PELO
MDKLYYYMFFAVVTLNIYTGPFSEIGNENEITPNQKAGPSEMRKRRDLSLKETWLKKRAVYKKKELSTFDGIYVREAYRVSDDEIRFVYLENQDNNMNLRAEVPSLGWQPVEWFCFNSTCFDYLFCSMATRFGRVRLPKATPHQPYLHITTETNEEFAKVRINDVRLHPTKHHYQHTLGVCLQPIFFFTDWTVIMQFFESWIAQGATKFYFYLHSYTWQTKKY